MTIQEYHREFKIAADKVDSLQFADFTDVERVQFLNEAVLRFVKQRYSKNNIYQMGFEEIQKRTDDLKALVRSSTNITPVNFTGNSVIGSNVITVTAGYNNIQIGQTISGGTIIGTQYVIDVLYNTIKISQNLTATTTGITFTVTNQGATNLGVVTGDLYGYSYRRYSFPSDYMFYLRSAVSVTYSKTTNCVTTTPSYINWVKPVRTDDLDKVLYDPFNCPNKSTHIGVFLNNEFRIYFDGEGDSSYALGDLNLTYIKYPKTYSTTDTNTEIELSLHTHKEILQESVRIAQSYIQNTEGVQLTKDLQTQIE